MLALRCAWGGTGIEVRCLLQSAILQQGLSGGSLVASQGGHLQMAVPVSIRLPTATVSTYCTVNGVIVFSGTADSVPVRDVCPVLSECPLWESGRMPLIQEPVSVGSFVPSRYEPPGMKAILNRLRLMRAATEFNGCVCSNLVNGDGA